LPTRKSLSAAQPQPNARGVKTTLVAGILLYRAALNRATLDTSKKSFSTQNGSHVWSPVLLVPVAKNDHAAPPSAFLLHENWWVGGRVDPGLPGEVERAVNRLPRESPLLWNKTSLAPQPRVTVEPSSGI